MKSLISVLEPVTYLREKLEQDTRNILYMYVGITCFNLKDCFNFFLIHFYVNILGFSLLLYIAYFLCTFLQCFVNCIFFFILKNYTLSFITLALLTKPSTWSVVTNGIFKNHILINVNHSFSCGSIFLKNDTVWWPIFQPFFPFSFISAVYVSWCNMHESAIYPFQ